MGQIVNVVERPSPRAGIVRFETNRALSGMGHERYVAGQRIEDVRPVDELARRIIARGGVRSVHINGGVITVELEDGFTSDGIADIVRGLYTFYVATPMEAPDAESAGVEQPADEGALVAERNEELTAEHRAAEAAAAAAPEPEESPAAGDTVDDAAQDGAVKDGAVEDGTVEVVATSDEAARATLPKDAGEPTDEPTEAPTEGHGEVVADPADAPSEAEGTIQPAAADVADDEP